MKKTTSDSYDDLVKRYAGERPAGRGARRREAGPTDTPARDVTTDSHPEEVAARATLLARRRGELRVPGVSADRLRDLVAQTDENLGYVAPVVASFAAAFPRVAAAAQADINKEAIAAAARQWAEMGKLRGTAAQLRQNVSDTRRQLGGEGLEDMRAMATFIRAQLEPGAADGKDQDRLRSETLEFMTAWERFEREPQAEREKTIGETAAHAEALGAEEARGEVLREMLALQEGGPVDQAEWDRAAARYDALVSEAQPDNRRARAR